MKDHSKEREAILSTSFYYSFMRLSHAMFPFFGIKFHTPEEEETPKSPHNREKMRLKGITNERAVDRK